MKVREGRETGVVEREKSQQLRRRWRETPRTERKRQEETSAEGKRSQQAQSAPRVSATRAGCRLGEEGRDHHSGWGGPSMWVPILPSALHHGET